MIPGRGSGGAGVCMRRWIYGMITGMWSIAGWSVGGWEMMRIACRECRELVEEPALYSEEDEGMLLHGVSD